MSKDLFLPPIPKAKIYTDGEMSLPWQEFFINLYSRVGGISSISLLEVTNSIISELLSVQNNNYRRIKELEDKIDKICEIRTNKEPDLKSVYNMIYGMGIINTPLSQGEEIMGYMFGLPLMEKTVDFSAIGWKESGTHELFTVTGGRIHGFIQFYCTETLAPGGSTLQAGTASDTDKFFPVTTCTDFVAGDLWASDGTTTKSVLGNGAVEFWTSEDIGYQLINDSTDGTGIFSLWWEAVDSGATIAFGAGGSL